MSWSGSAPARAGDNVAGTQSPRLAADPAWERVKRWEGVRGEPRLAWLALWELLGRRPGTLRGVTLAWLASQYDSTVRSAERWIEALARAGLVQVIDAGSRMTLQVLDPLDVGRGRVLVLDPQLEMPEIAGPDVVQFTSAQGAGQPSGVEAAASTCEARPALEECEIPADPPGRRVPSADPPADPPAFPLARARAPSEPSEDLSATKPSTITIGRTRSDGALDQPRGGSAGGSAEPAAIGSVLGQLVAADPTATLAAVEGLAAYIVRKVNDPALRMTPVLRLARAAVHDEKLAHELEEFLAGLGKAKSRGAYFVGFVKRQERERGI